MASSKNQQRARTWIQQGQSRPRGRRSLVALANSLALGHVGYLDTRYRRQREWGLSTPDDWPAVRSELWILRSGSDRLGRSLDDLRERWDQCRSGAQRRRVPDRCAGSGCSISAPGE
jgi:hypothetical protein